MPAYKKSLVPISDFIFFTDTNNEKEMDLILGLPKAFGLNDSSIAFSLSILQHLFANC